MKTKFTLLHTLGLCLLLGAANVYADMALDSDKQIEGTWRLEFSKKNADTAKVTERSDTWIIEKGKLLVKGIEHSGNRPYDSAPASYAVEDGLFKVYIRPGKFDAYSLIERAGDVMVLKDKMGVLYHFKKK